MNRHVFYVGMTLLCLFFLSFTAVRANNVRIHGEPRWALNARQDTLSLTFTLSWDNSWRDDFNWDAVWVFGKYKKEGSTDAWLPLLFAPVQSEVNQVSVITTDGTSETRGVYVYPRKKGSYAQIKEEVTLKCRLSALGGITAADINNGLVYFSLTGIEMVLVPYGSYYLGDNKSNFTFRSHQSRLFPPEDDIIGTDTAFVYSSYPEAATNYEPFKVADRVNGSGYCHITSRTDSISWMVDFKTPKTIRTTAVFWLGGYNPTQSWYWLGSNNLEKWDTLRHCQVEECVSSGWSYPMHYPMKMEKTGAYRYYRLFAKTVGGNGFAVYNIAMSERDLYSQGEHSYYVKDEAAITYGKTLDYVYVEDGTSWSGSLPASYPKGYRGFYCMKYEVSQEQYVSFLNMLSYNQQKNRIGGNLDELNKGEYVFGSNTKAPNCRNGIVLMSKSGATQPAVFACNLNPAEPFNAEDDGKTLACNYMTPADMLAYLEWCGLRPLSEMEYEKACRAPRKVLPGEKAWNGTEQKPLTGLADVNNAGRENELPKNAGFNVNAGNGVAGPVRCGSFATASTTQEQAGATFYGVMEMSGNLGELCYHVKGGSGFNCGYGYGHGNGSLDANGNQQNSYWPEPTTTDAFIVRGGSFASADTLLAVSDRSQVVKDPARRDSTVGFRGAHIAEAYTLEGGSISGAEYGCPDKPYLVTGSDVTAGEGMVVRYEWYINIGNGFELIDGQYNKDLNYTGLVNNYSGMLTYYFKRKAYCALGEAWSNEITVRTPNPKVKLDLPRVVIDPCDYAPEMTAIPVMSDNTMTYVWKFAGRPIEGQTTNKYTPKREHFGGANGEMEVVCETALYGCVAESLFRVEIPFVIEMKSTDVTLSNCNNATYKYGEDVYCSVRIGDQCWMAKNLNIGNENLGNNYAARTAGIQKYCMGCDVYGGIYEWDEVCSGGLVNDVKYVNDDPGTGLIQGICPEGWHIPSDEEWMTLERSLGMSEEEIQKNNSDRGTDQGIQMKSTDYWTSNKTNRGTNISGLNMRPGGFCYPSNYSPRCQGSGRYGYWWTATKYDSGNVYARSLSGSSKVTRKYAFRGDSYFYHYSVRCVLNPR